MQTALCQHISAHLASGVTLSPLPTCWVWLMVMFEQCVAATLPSMVILTAASLNDRPLTMPQSTQTSYRAMPSHERQPSMLTAPMHWSTE